MIINICCEAIAVFPGVVPKIIKKEKKNCVFPENAQHEIFVTVGVLFFRQLFHWR